MRYACFSIWNVNARAPLINILFKEIYNLAFLAFTDIPE